MVVTLSLDLYEGRDIRLQMLISNASGREINVLTTIRTITIPDKKVTLRHLAKIVLVQKLAALSLLAESSQPMLAHEIIEIRIAVCRGMFVWTR